VSLLRYAMLPAPASIAAPPAPKSAASCRPAVPPPPVAGAPVGTGAGEKVVCVTVGDKVGDGLTGDGDGEGLAERLADGLGLALEEGTLAVPLKKPVGDGELPSRAADVASGVEMLGAAVGWAAVHAETAEQASTVTVPQPIAVSLARVAAVAMAARTVMNAPRARKRHRP